MWFIKNVDLTEDQKRIGEEHRGEEHTMDGDSHDGGRTANIEK